MNEYDRMREAVARRSAIDPRLRAILRRIGKGTATFADTAEYSRICAEITGRELSGGVLELSDREGVCTQLLRDGYEDINEICGTVQLSLDDKQGLHIAPQKAVFPAERVSRIAHSLVDPTVPDETIQRRAGKSVENVYFSFHDDYIKENAKFRSDAGLKCYINRVMGSKACSWCADLAGRYPYSYDEMPEDIFRRHDNCTCTVTFENGRQRQNVWTKRTWETPDKDAGAPEPTVLSREQAERLQNERLAGYKGLTSDKNGDIISSGSENMVEIMKLGKLDTQPLEEEFGKLKTDEIIVTNERIEHIKEHHPEDYSLFEKFGVLTVEKPDLIIKDGKNENTVFMIRQLEDSNLNVVAKLILDIDDSDRKNSVMTFYRIRDKNLVKLEKRNKTLYKKE